MDNSIDWIFDLDAEYRAKTNRQPYFPSTWDIDADALALPRAMVERALQKSLDHSHEYLFVDELIGCKDDYAALLKRTCGLEVPREQIAIMPNVTAALFLSLKALGQLGATRFLVVTPCYFSVLDTLKDMDASIFFHHLQDSEEFCIDVDRLQRDLEHQFIDAVIVTDPVFCAGRDISVSLYKELSIICRDHDCWLLCDNALGGLSWEAQRSALECTDKLEALRDNPKFVYIGSATKKLFLNGIKIAVISAPMQVVSVVEHICDYSLGGITSVQVALFREIYSQEHEATILGLLDTNLRRIKDNWSALRAILHDTSYDMYSPQSGFFTIVHHRRKTIAEVDVPMVTRRYLFECDCLTIPNSRFSYYSANRFGFRVSLYKDKESLLVPVRRCVNIEL